MGSINIQITTEKAPSGVAPLLVFFDATGTTSSITARPFHELHSIWDFGDPTSGTWEQSGLSKNQARGLVAAHVYENPGVYTATLRVWDVQGGYAIQTVQVTVAAFSGTTYYVSSSGGNDAWPGTEAQPFQSFVKAWAMLATNVRMLFKRGDTWAVDANPVGGERRVTTAGPGIVGAYGSGARPHFDVSTSVYDVHFIFFDTDDWRIMDLEAEAVGTPKCWGGFGWTTWRTDKYLLFQRCNAIGFGVSHGCYADDARTINPHLCNGFVECESSDKYYYSCYFFGKYIAVFGCNFVEGPTVIGNHNVRSGQMHKSLIQHNRLYGMGNSQDHVIKIHSPNIALGPYYTQFAIISDNLITGTGASTWVIAVRPQSSAPVERDEWIYDVIIERNDIKLANAVNQLAILIHSINATVRNNILDGSVESLHEFYGLWVGYYLEGYPLPYISENIHCYNNTIVSYGGGARYTACMLHLGDPSTIGTIFRNNYGIFEGFTTKEILDDPYPQVIADHNTLTDYPMFVNPALRDYRLQQGAPGEDTGMTIENLDDMDRKARYGVLFDQGAYERIAGELPLQLPGQPKIGRPLTGVRKTTNFF